MGRKRTVTDEQIQEMVKMYRDGATIREVSESLGVNPMTVQRYLSANTEMRPRGRRKNISIVSEKPFVKDDVANKEPVQEAVEPEPCVEDDVQQEVDVVDDISEDWVDADNDVDDEVVSDFWG